MGGIDNEALDFGQLESFTHHIPAINTSISNGNATTTTATAIILTAASTTPTNTITATVSGVATNTPAHGLLFIINSFFAFRKNCVHYNEILT